MPERPVSSYVVLGLLDHLGPSTPYGLDQYIRSGIGYFWSFPRSQLYAEAARLVRLGLVAEDREDVGRRRRLLSITPAGRQEFRVWLDAVEGVPTELRDDGLLRLFLHPADAGPEAVVRLARTEKATHEAQLAQYETLMAEIPRRATPQQVATLRLGLRFEQLCVDFWAEVEATVSMPGSDPGDGSDPGPRLVRSELRLHAGERPTGRLTR